MGCLGEGEGGFGGGHGGVEDGGHGGLGYGDLGQLGERCGDRFGWSMEVVR